MKIRKIAAVAAVVAVGVVAQATAEHEPSHSNDSGVSFRADLKTGYERLNLRVKSVHGRHLLEGGAWGVRAKLGLEESSTGLGLETRLGGVTSLESNHSFASADVGASIGWNLGSFLGDAVVFRPSVGYEARYLTHVRGLHTGLDIGTSLAGHEIGVRGGLHFPSGVVGYDIAAHYNYKVFAGMGIGIEAGLRSYGKKLRVNGHKLKDSATHYHILGGINFSF